MDTRLLLILVVQLAGTLLPTTAQDLEGCWETKGCFKQPADCTGDDCTAYVTWEPLDGGLFLFSMRGKTSGWVAFGLRDSSVTSGMSPADVYACTSGNPDIVRSKNVSPLDSESIPIPAGAVTKQSVNVEGDTIACQFTRNASIVGDDSFYDITVKKYYILLAIGPAVNGDGSIAGNRHTERWPSPNTFQLSDVSVPNLDGCGVTKGCFKKPDGCTVDNCMAFVTWKPIGGGNFRFSMKASQVPSVDWVAIGLGIETGTDRMSPADVYSCTSFQELQRSFNVHPYPGDDSYDSKARNISDLPLGAVTKESVVFADNVISCQFTRKESINGDSEFYDISGSKKYYILMAVGDEINANGTIQGHEHVHDWHTRSPLVLSEVNTSVTTPMPPVTTPGDLTGCGETKGCFPQPSGCTGADCSAYVTWQTLKNGLYQFTLMGREKGYVAFGLRPGSTPDGDSGMIPADVYACTSKAEVKRSENERNGGLNSNPRNIPVDSISVISTSFENDVIRCQFTRKPFIDGDDKFYNISEGNEYFILLAIGSSINADGTIQSNYHDSSRWLTSKPMSLTTAIPEEDRSGIRLRKAHASLMVIAWIGFASIGITLARFFKPMWPNSKLFGTKIWFTIHRMCMVTCVLCFSVAFILIFVAVGGFVETINTTTVVHAILGIIVTVLGIVNPIMAIFRPHPGTPNRPLFNWAHWGVGTSAHTIAIVTVFLGIGYQSSLLAGLNQYVFWVMVVFTAFHTLIWILFEVQRCMTESQGICRRNDIPLQGTGGSSTDNIAGPDEPPAATSTSLSGEIKERQIQEGVGSQVDKEESEFQEGASSQVTHEGSTAKTVLLVVYVSGVVIMMFFLLVNFIIA